MNGLCITAPRYSCVTINTEGSCHLSIFLTIFHHNIELSDTSHIRIFTTAQTKMNNNYSVFSNYQTSNTSDDDWDVELLQSQKTNETTEPEPTKVHSVLAVGITVRQKTATEPSANTSVKIQSKSHVLPPVSTKPLLSFSGDFNQCVECNMSFMDENRLIAHKKKVHSYGKKQKCDFCSLEFLNDSEKSQHVLSVHGSSQFKCDHCPLTFEREATKKFHTRLAHGRQGTEGMTVNNDQGHSVGKMFACQVGSSEFQNNSERSEHVLSAHGKDPFKCDHCPLTFTRSRSKAFHTGLAHEAQTSKTQASETQTSERLTAGNDKWDSIRRKYTCDFCNTDFQNDSERGQHVLSVHGGKPFQCEHCPLTFTKEATKKFHTRVAHERQMPVKHECGTCKASFSNRTSLTYHISSVHDIDNAFQCTKCPKRFSRPLQRDRHERNAHGKVW